MRYRHVIFDLDGTLIDTEATHSVSLIQTARELMGLEMTMEEAYPFFAIPSADAPVVLGYADVPGFMDLWEKYYRLQWHLSKPFDGALEVVQAVKAAGCGTGVVTSRSRREFGADPNMKTFGQYFDVVTCAGDTPRPKPYPDAVYRYMEISGAVAEDIVFVGDTAMDAACAHSAGLPFACADWGRRGVDDISHEYVFHSADELREILL